MAPTINTTSPSTSSEQIVKPPGEKTNNTTLPLNQPKQQDNGLPIVFNNTTDSSFVNPVVLPDSNKVLPNILVQNPLPDLPKTIDSVQQGKKKRGVSGITDNDYRIVPKKDSSK